MTQKILCSLFLYFLSFPPPPLSVYVVCIFKSILFFKLLFIPIVCVCEKMGGRLDLAAVFLSLHSVGRVLLLTDGKRERNFCICSK